jgi:5-methyltetrahydropteroyltriglutamate--homocysteine methyltransferase
MTKRIRPPFRADHVGSFLRPKELLEARERHFKQNLGPS